MRKDSILNDLALGHYTSAYDTEFLDKYSQGNVMFVSIGRLIDVCTKFKRLKAFIGNDPKDQIELVQNIMDFMDDNASTVGINVYDAIDIFRIVVDCMFDKDFECCIGRKPTDEEYAAICAKIEQRMCSSGQDGVEYDYLFSTIQSVAEAAKDF